VLHSHVSIASFGASAHMILHLLQQKDYWHRLRHTDTDTDRHSYHPIRPFLSKNDLTVFFFQN
jgi:hypothetical protein